MNIPLAFESGINAILVDSADLSACTKRRTWQKLANDCSIDSEGNRAFPYVDIRCAPPVTDENQVTLYGTVEIVCATLLEDDKLHADVQELYGKVQGEVDTLYKQWRNTPNSPPVGGPLAVFLAAVEASLIAQAAGNAGVVNIGGFSFQDGLSPYDDEGRNTIGIALRVHYTRSDF